MTLQEIGKAQRNSLIVPSRRPVAACSAKADGNGTVLQAPAAPGTSEPPFILTGGYKSDKIGELRKTLYKINQKRR